jgi:hypothetical protein
MDEEGSAGGMRGQCAICEAAVPDSAAHCTACGFPMAISDLAARLIVDLPEPESAVVPPQREGNGGFKARIGDRSVAPPPRDPQTEVVNRIARDVSHAVSLLQDLGGDGSDIANELAQAAFTEAEGRVGEVLVLLRDAQGRVSIRLKEQFESRLKQLEERQTAMITSGVSVNLRTEIERIRTDVRAGRREAALQRIDLVDRNLSSMESDWRGLQGLLRQIEGLREAARLLELDVSEPDDSLRQVRVILAQPALDIGALDHAAELAAEAVMRLHDSIPLALEEFLDRLSTQVSTWPSSFDGRRRAGDLDREARKLLKSNRLVDATQRATELQQLIAATGVPPAPLATEEVAPPPVEAPPVVKPTERPTVRKPERIDRPAPMPRPPPAETPPPAAAAPVHPAEKPSPPTLPRADTVRALVAQARELAARIQRLPGDSDLARAAAVEIRNATELLRERNMDEAERTLSDLRERLDRALKEKQG